MLSTLHDQTLVLVAVEKMYRKAYPRRRPLSLQQRLDSIARQRMSIVVDIVIKMKVQVLVV